MLPSLVHFFYRPLRLIFVEVRVLHSLWTILSSIGAFVLHFLFFNSFFTDVLFPLIIFIRFFRHYVSLHRIVKPVLGNDFDKYVNNRGLKFDTNVLF